MYHSVDTLNNKLGYPARLIIPLCTLDIKVIKRKEKNNSKFSRHEKERSRCHFRAASVLSKGESTESWNPEFPWILSDSKDP